MFFFELEFEFVCALRHFLKSLFHAGTTTEVYGQRERDGNGPVVAVCLQREHRDASLAL